MTMDDFVFLLVLSEQLESTLAENYLCEQTHWEHLCQCKTDFRSLKPQAYLNSRDN